MTSFATLAPIPADTDLCEHCSSRLRGAPWCSLCGQPRHEPATPLLRRFDLSGTGPGWSAPAPAPRTIPARQVPVLQLLLSVTVLAWPVWHLLVNLASIEDCIFCQIREFVLFCAVGIALCAIWGRGVELRRTPAPPRAVWFP